MRKGDVNLTKEKSFNTIEIVENNNSRENARNMAEWIRDSSEDVWTDWDRIKKEASMILERISAEMDRFSDSQRKVAQYILSTYEEAAFLTAAKGTGVYKLS